MGESVTPGSAALERLAAEIFAEALERVRAAGPRVPLATYRVQLNRDFTFSQAREVVPYLRELGVSDLYCSPFFKARPDSTHGYDIVDHNQLNPVLGTREEFDLLTDALRSERMGLLLDFVPNHMGIASAENAWWMDVLENGPSSLFAAFFDVDWRPLKSELENKVLLPILGDHYGRVLDSGQLRVEHDGGGFFLRYHEHVLPVNPRTYPRILEPLLPGLVDALGEESDVVLELQSIVTGFHHLPPRTEPQRPKVIERRREKEILKKRLAVLAADSPEVARGLEASLLVLNGRSGDPRSFDALDAFLEEQPYRLSFWRVAAEEINYRRFFDINDLAAIRMEQPAVFAAAHRLLFELVGEGRVTGLRIDHPDGLWEPPAYFTALHQAHLLEACRRVHAERRGAGEEESPERARERLKDVARLVPLWAARFSREREAAPEGPLRRPLYIVAEKILTRGERLPAEWPVHGTSGYDFANLVTGVLVDRATEREMSAVYERLTGEHLDFERLVYEKKKLVLQASMASELNVLAHALNRLSERDRHSRDFTLNSLTVALREVIACFPVYRTYVGEGTAALDDHDRGAVERAVRRALARNPTTDASVFRFLRGILMLEAPPTAPPEDRQLWRQFVMRFQQLTGPVMAKGLEDTAFYVYNRLVALNEVGGEPEIYGLDVAAFHRANEERQRWWPGSLAATSTHDTKRSEDVRARVCVLSEMPEGWERAVAGFREVSAALRTELEGRVAPDPNEEYLLYQALVGTWPFEPLSGEALAGYAERIVAYMRKATKEAKVNTSWVDATPEYDAAVEQFVRRLLAPSSGFVERMEPLAKTVSFHGMWSSLSQVLLRSTAPGVPDLYQGNELWDFSLVDPDNRRPVDYGLRRAVLRDLRERARAADRLPLARELVAAAEDGRIKLYVTFVALNLRRRRAAVYGAEGGYHPVEPRGARSDCVVSFARRREAVEVVTVAPRLTLRLAGGKRRAPLGATWRDTAIAVRDGWYRDAFTGAVHHARSGQGLELAEVLAEFPVALLERVAEEGAERPPAEES